MIRIIIAVLTTFVLAGGTVSAEEVNNQDIVFFNLAKHVEDLEGEPCSVCHLPGAKSIMPEKEVCLECHDQELMDRVRFPQKKTHGPMWLNNHGKLAKMGMYSCSTCHEQETCVQCHEAGFPDEFGEFSNNFMNVHRSDFKVTHPLYAKTDSRLCVNCHETQFCFDCHSSFKDNSGLDLSFSSHKQSWRTRDAFGQPHSSVSTSDCKTCHPDSVLPAHEWTKSHAREARRNLQVCQSCHPNGDTCLTCHSAISGLGVNPHPRDWGKMMGRLKTASDGRLCRKCHNSY